MLRNLVWMSVLVSQVNGTAMLTLTSQPQTSGTYCPGPVTYTCQGREIDALFWVVNGSIVAAHPFRSTDTYPLSLSVSSSLVDVTAEITSASANPSTYFDVNSTIHVGDIWVLNGASLKCEESEEESNVIKINVNILTTPSSPSTSCSLLPSPGGAEVSLQWSPSFTSQYAVERYSVSVNPDPSSCSSEQVSPSEDYSCSGLVLGTLYNFTVSAINCGDQEGDRDTFTALSEASAPPADLEVVKDEKQQKYLVRWRQTSLSTERCSIDGNISYSVILEDSTGRILEQRVVTSDSCYDRLCSTSMRVFPDTYLVSVQTISHFGNSRTRVVFVKLAGVQLTTANQSLLSIGVILLTIAIVIFIILTVKTVKKASRKLVSRLLLALLMAGCVLIVISVVLWLVVAFQVGLQQNTFDSAWQSTRNNLITTAHVFSDVTFLVLFVANALVLVSNRGGAEEELTREVELGRDYEVPVDRSVNSQALELQQKEVYGFGDGIEMKRNQVYGLSLKKDEKPYDIVGQINPPKQASAE